ncbi:MAG TPA: hypothetical protein VHR47_06920 [Bacillota bacterium]|nr:hypothetical protein [Bacillota bacterium]
MVRRHIRSYLGILIIVAVFAGTLFVYADSNDEYYENGRSLGYLRLPAFSVDLGPLRTDPTDPRGRRCFFEAIDVMPVTYKCDKVKHGADRPKDWEVRISGDDFRNGSEVIPISQLRWRVTGGSYRNMPSQGSWDIIDDATNYTGKERYAEHTKPLSLFLSLTNDEYAGTYQGTFYATLIFF